jgi:hypothetical protein
MPHLTTHVPLKQFTLKSKVYNRHMENKKNALNAGDFQLGYFGLSKDRILHVPDEVYKYLPSTSSETLRQFKDNRSVFRDLNYLARKPAAELSQGLNISVPPNDGDTFVGKLLGLVKLLSKVKKVATGDLLNLANPLVDPYIRSGDSGVSSKVSTTFRIANDNPSNSKFDLRCDKAKRKRSFDDIIDEGDFIDEALFNNNPQYTHNDEGTKKMKKGVEYAN